MTISRNLKQDKFLMQLRAFAYCREVSTDYGNDSVYLKRVYWACWFHPKWPSYNVCNLGLSSFRDGADKQIITFWCESTTTTKADTWIVAPEPCYISKLLYEWSKVTLLFQFSVDLKKSSFQSNGSGLVLANTIEKSLSIFRKTARLILVNSVTIISYPHRL